jgi:hypothetical protein
MGLVGARPSLHSFNDLSTRCQSPHRIVYESALALVFGPAKHTRGAHGHISSVTNPTQSRMISISDSILLDAVWATYPLRGWRKICLVMQYSSIRRTLGNG